MLKCLERRTLKLLFDIDSKEHSGRISRDPERGSRSPTVVMETYHTSMSGDCINKTHQVCPKRVRSMNSNNPFKFKNRLI